VERDGVLVWDGGQKIRWLKCEGLVWRGLNWGIGLGFQTRRRVWGGRLVALERGAAWTTHIAKLWAGLRLKIPRIFLFASSLLPLRVSYLLPL